MRRGQNTKLNGDCSRKRVKRQNYTGTSLEKGSKGKAVWGLASRGVKKQIYTVSGLKRGSSSNSAENKWRTKELSRYRTFSIFHKTHVLCFLTSLKFQNTSMRTLDTKLFVEFRFLKWRIKTCGSLQQVRFEEFQFQILVRWCLHDAGSSFILVPYKSLHLLT